jgi:hypothetical protein
LKSIHSKEDSYYVNVFDANRSSRTWQNEIVEVDPSIRVEYEYGKSWGLFPVVQATIDSMRYFSTVNYDYFINLSGQCYPLKSLSAIKNHLQGQKTAFMETFQLPYAGWGSMGGLERTVFFFHKHPVFTFRDWALNRVMGRKHFETRRLLRVPKIKTHIPCGHQPYCGSAYFCLTKKHVDYILRYLG